MGDGNLMEAENIYDVMLYLYINQAVGLIMVKSLAGQLSSRDNARINASFEKYREVFFITISIIIFIMNEFH